MGCWQLVSITANTAKPPVSAPKMDWQGTSQGRLGLERTDIPYGQIPRGGKEKDPIRISGTRTTCRNKHGPFWTQEKSNDGGCDRGTRQDEGELSVGTKAGRGPWEKGAMGGVEVKAKG